MKLLRNPIVTGILAIVAVVVVYLQVAPHSLRLGLSSSRSPGLPMVSPPPPQPAPAAPAPAPAAAAPQASRISAEANIDPPRPVDREFVELHFDGWVNWPQRDPFLVITPDAPDLKNQDVDLT